MGDEAPTPDSKVPALPFKPPEFDWSSPNLYSQFKLFQTKYDYAFKGTYSGNSKEAKVSAILDWLRDSAYEIHSNLNWATPAYKNNPDKVLDELRNISNQHITNITLGTHWLQFTQANLGVNLNSW